MDTSGKMFRHGVLRALDYVGKDPDKNLPKLMKWVDRFAGNGENSMESQRAVFRKLINDPNDSTLQNCPRQRQWSAEWHFPNR